MDANINKEAKTTGTRQRMTGSNGSRDKTAYPHAHKCKWW